MFLSEKLGNNPFRFFAETVDRHLYGNDDMFQPLGGWAYVVTGVAMERGAFNTGESRPRPEHGRGMRERRVLTPRFIGRPSPGVYAKFVFAENPRPTACSLSFFQCATLRAVDPHGEPQQLSHTSRCHDGATFA